VNKKKGREATVDIKESKNADGLSIFITQVAVVSCALTQVPDKRLATQIRQYVGLRRAVNVDEWLDIRLKRGEYERRR
jgi:hypothetical protein